MHTCTRRWWSVYLPLRKVDLGPYPSRQWPASAARRHNDLGRWRAGDYDRSERHLYARQCIRRFAHPHGGAGGVQLLAGQPQRHNRIGCARPGFRSADWPNLNDADARRTGWADFARYARAINSARPSRRYSSSHHDTGVYAYSCRKPARVGLRRPRLRSRGIPKRYSHAESDV